MDPGPNRLEYTPLATGDEIDDTGTRIVVKRVAGGGTLRVEQPSTGTRTYSYAYGAGGVAGLFANPYALACALFASLGGLTFGYDQGVIANVLVMKDFQTKFPVTPFQQGLLTAVLEFGALLGALAAGALADRLSRRYAICVGCVIFCVGSALQCGADTLGQLRWGRALGGVGIGSLSMLCPLYIGEISPPELRGSLLSIEQFSIVLGVVIGFWLGFWTRSLQGSASWRIPLGAQLIPGILLGLGVFLLPPSPRLLVSLGKETAGAASLAKLRMLPHDDAESDHPLLKIELLEMKVEARLTHNSRSGATEPGWREAVLSWTCLFDQKYRKQIMIGIMVMFFQQWTGINALLYYGPSLMKSMGLEGDTVLLVGSGFINIVQFLAVLPAIIYIDRLGRKPLLIGGAAVMAMSHALISMMVWIGQDDWKTHQTQAWAAVGLVYVFTCAYGVSFGPVAWVLPSEVFPLSVRSKGVALSTASNWLNNFLVGLSTPVMIQWSPVATYLIFGLFSGLACLWSTVFVPETKGRSLEEMDTLFRSSAGSQDAQKKHQLEAELGLHSLIDELLQDR